MGSPQTESAPVVSTPADPQAAAAGWEAAAKATDGAAEAVGAAATSEVTELKGKVAALEQKLETVLTALKEGLHNRVNELENTIKRKFPYG